MKKTVSMFLIMILVMLLSSCGGSFQEGINNPFLGAGEEERQIYLIGYNFESNNPLLVKNNENRHLFSLIYDSLMVLDQAYQPVYSLAEHAISYQDGLSWRVTLREGVLFHHGTELSASDVAATVQYLLNNNTYYDYQVRNIISAKAENPYTVIFSLKAPAQNFLAQLTFPIVNSKEILSGSNFNGTGRFKVENYVKRKKIQLIRNDNYFKKEKMQINKVEVQLVPDQETANYSYSSGLADVFSQDVLSDKANALAKSGTSSMEYYSNLYSFLLWNRTLPVFSDPGVRKAIHLALDREKLMSDILFSHGVKAVTPVSPASYFANPNLGEQYRPEEAKTILAERGYVPNINTGVLEREENGKAIPLSFKILVNSDNNFRIQTANYIKESLKYIGIEVGVLLVSWEEYQKAFDSKQYEAILATIPMALDFDLTPFFTPGTFGDGGGEMITMILQNIAQSDYGPQKLQYYNRLQEEFLEELPHISLYYAKHTLQYADKIKEGLNPVTDNIFYNIENWSF